MPKRKSYQGRQTRLTNYYGSKRKRSSAFKRSDKKRRKYRQQLLSVATVQKIAKKEVNKGIDKKRLIWMMFPFKQNWSYPSTIPINMLNTDVMLDVNTENNKILASHTSLFSVRGRKGDDTGNLVDFAQPITSRVAGFGTADINGALVNIPVKDSEEDYYRTGQRIRVHSLSVKGCIRRIREYFIEQPGEGTSLAGRRSSVPILVRVMIVRFKLQPKALPQLKSVPKMDSWAFDNQKRDRQQCQILKTKYFKFTANRHKAYFSFRLRNFTCDYGIGNNGGTVIANDVWKNDPDTNNLYLYWDCDVVEPFPGDPTNPNMHHLVMQPSCDITFSDL